MRPPLSLSRVFPIISGALVILSSTFAHASGPVPLEYQIKASFIFNFLQFVEWPPPADGHPATSLRLCVAGENPFGVALDSLEDELVNSMHLKIERLPDPTPSEFERCQAIFFSRSLDNRLSTIVPGLRDKGILTIGESDTFLDRGGILRFVIVDNKVGFEVNRTAASDSRLTISSKLLRLARGVRN